MKSCGGIVRTGAAVLLFGLAAPLLPTSTASAMTEFCMEDGDEVEDSYFDAPTTDETPVEVRMGGRTYVIPRNYFRFGQRACRTGEARTIVLRMTLPEFLPATDDTWERLYGKVAGLEDDYIQLSASTQTIRDMRRLLEFRLRYRLPGREAPPLDGTASFVSGHENQEVITKDVYVWPNLEQPEAMIVCNTIRGANDPKCRIHFMFNDLIWRPLIDRKYLVSWHNIVSGLHQKINGMISIGTIEGETHVPDAE